MNKLYKAKLTNLRSGPRKVSIILDEIRNMNLSDALVSLDFMNKKVAEPIKKLILSAVANAEDTDGVDISDLKINELYVTHGNHLKRGKAVSRGRYHRITKHRSNLFVKLERK